MPRFFVNIRCANRLIRDYQGDVFIDLLAVIEDTIQAGREMAAQGLFAEPCSIEITDRWGALLATVPFKNFATH